MEFKAVLPDFPEGNISSEERENPDFIVKRSTGRLGIEVTQLFRDVPDGKRPMQEQESLRQRVLNAAHAMYDGQAGPAIWVSVHFSTSVNLTKQRAPQLGEQIARLVLSSLPAPDDSTALEEQGNEQEKFPEEVSLISIRRRSFLTKSSWSDPVAEFVPECQPNAVQSVIDDKNGRYSDYQKEADEVWLLIVADGGNHSSWMDLSESVNMHRFDCKFDRAFLFRRSERQVVELLRK